MTNYIRSIYSINKSNFIATEMGLKKTHEEIDDSKIQSFMQGHFGDWIKWYKIPPLASYMSAVW